jgi:hypothetical protein
MTPETTEEVTETNEPVAQETPDTAESVQSDEQAQPSQPDVGEQLAALRQDIAALREGGAEDDSDLYQQLSGYDEYESPAQDFESEQGQGQEPPDPFEEMVRERVAEATYPILMGIETDRRRQRLESIADAHPELRTQEVQDAIADRLAPLAERYGNEMILTDPDLIEQHLLAVKAERASSAETPAEQARGRDAGLERGAAASAPESGLSPEEAIKKGILESGRGGNAFV